ncbi:serine protein kinase RIO [soil metagenome]|nr:serine protein kinase RIO [Deinococcota bacterium]
MNHSGDFDLEDSFESFSKRKDRRKPAGRRSVYDLAAEDDKGSSVALFSDPGLQALYERGLITDLVGQLKSGKEATVYVAEGPKGLLAAKIYTDIRIRSFRVDRVYREGRFIGDQRLQRAIDQRSETGLSAQQALWIAEEYGQLQTFYQAGIPVPEPVAQVGAVVLMTFIGDEGGPAPRLSEVQLAPYQAEDALEQSVRIFIQMLKLGRVHGDYSTFNLLWWRGSVIAIDFPQVVTLKDNPSAWALLERDARSLCKSFGRFGLRPDPAQVLRRAREEAEL